MTREEELDWLYRLRSEIYVFMPKEWLIPMNNALDMAIKYLEQESSGSENPNNCEMRDATLEERESIDKYIKSISKPTGVKFGALEQKPSGDLISRGEVLENAFKIYTHECGLVEVVGVATIKALPSIKPQTGHWKEVGEEYIQVYDLNGISSCGDERICSECGFETVFIGEHCSQYKFCPNCGVKMEVEKNG